ncbi:MAG TPA: hypothetical protein VFH45_13525 [Acidimicrobiales bacterium]|nr:hypothetical protein [Acidimicrobiales bacterium]
MDQETRRAHEEEIRRRWDAGALVSAHGDLGAAMVEVVRRAESLSVADCGELVSAYGRMHDDAEAAGLWRQVEECYAYTLPYPEYPGNLFAIDPLARAAMGYAGLAARERAASLGAPSFVPVERTALGAVIELARRLADHQGVFFPVEPVVCDLLARPWGVVVSPAR